ncbi:MAG TPA: hypothetical protein VLM89_05005 [Phycisphaerae bacterium]|nr:hypothetical protein [Phycisphaerae bacterium]
MSRNQMLLALGLLPLACGGCASYTSVVRPTPSLSVLSPELKNLTEATIETYLKANATPTFPTVLAVAKLDTGTYDDRYNYRRDAIKALAVVAINAHNQPHRVYSMPW